MESRKQRILVVDDDDAARELIRAYLEDRYEVIDTGDPEQALRITLECKPSAILLDLSMPGFTGFELCKTLSSLSFTQGIPVFIVSSEDRRNKAFCESLGAVDYFQKPVDSDRLRARLERIIEERKTERRAAPRTNTRLPITLRWKDAGGTPQERRTVTENVSATGFLCGCKAPLEIGTHLEVFFGDNGEHYMDAATVVRIQGAGSDRLYGCHFVTEQTSTTPKA